MPANSTSYDYESYEITGRLVWRETFTGYTNEYPRRRDRMRLESIELTQGDNRTFQVYVKDRDENPIDLTGASAAWTLRTEKGATAASLVKSGTIGSADEGEVLFYFVPTNTSSLSIRQYVFDVRVTLSNSKKYTVVDGVFNLLEPVGG